MFENFQKKNDYFCYLTFLKIPPAQFKCDTAHLCWDKVTIAEDKSPLPAPWEPQGNISANGKSMRGGAPQDKKEVHGSVPKPGPTDVTKSCLELLIEPI